MEESTDDRHVDKGCPATPWIKTMSTAGSEDGDDAAGELGGG